MREHAKAIGLRLDRPSLLVSQGRHLPLRVVRGGVGRYCRRVVRIVGIVEVQDLDDVSLAGGGVPRQANLALGALADLATEDELLRGREGDARGAGGP